MSSKPGNPVRKVQQVRHLTQHDLAKRWDKSEATIERYRALGISPRFLKIGGRVLFREEDVLEYERNRLYEANALRAQGVLA
jgi:hypothetical protein